MLGGVGGLILEGEDYLGITQAIPNQAFKGVGAAM